jgi:hypothetical protein
MISDCWKLASTRCALRSLSRARRICWRHPFSSEDEIDFPVTVGEFIRLYEQAVVSRAA